MCYVSRSEHETYEFARRLAQSLSVPVHILLFGDLGTGKTVFAKGLVDGFGSSDVEEVSSPTFTIINEYRGPVKIYHVDLYRLKPAAVAELGLEEIFDDNNAVVIVEWAERLNLFEEPGPIKVFLKHVDEGTRQIEVQR